MDHTSESDEKLKRSEHMRLIGSKGGLAKVPKGFAKMEKGRLREVSQIGLDSRWHSGIIHEKKVDPWVERARQSRLAIARSQEQNKTVEGGK